MNIYILYIIFPIWLLCLVLLFSHILFNKILTKYKMVTSEVSFEELLIALNAAINTEIELWERDVFIDKHAITNSNFENFYNEITMHIIKSLSDTFFINMEKYISEDAVISIIGRRTKEYLTGKIQ